MGLEQIPFPDYPEGVDKRQFPRAIMWEGELLLVAKDVSDYLRWFAENVANRHVDDIPELDREAATIILEAAGQIIKGLADEMDVSGFRATLAEDAPPDPNDPRSDS